MSDSQKKPVVVAVKGEQPTLVRYAADEARRRRTELVVVHVYGVILAEVGAVVSTTSSPHDDAEAQAVLDAAKKVIDSQPDAPPARFIRELGSALEVIEQHAAHAQVLVIGADEISWFERMLGGAIARHLAGHAPCPVIVVPPIHDLSTLYGGVCVAIDDDARAAAPLRFAFEQASARDSRLIVLHVVPEGLKKPEVEAERVSVAEVLAGWSEQFPDVVVTTRVVSDDEVVSAAARASEESELLVVGRPRRDLTAIRAATPRLTRATHCPLAVVGEGYGTVDRFARRVDAGRTR